MILVSFSFAEDALCDDVKKLHFYFSLQGTANPLIRFFWGTPGIRISITEYDHLIYRLAHGLL